MPCLGTALAHNRQPRRAFAKMPTEGWALGVCRIPATRRVSLVETINVGGGMGLRNGDARLSTTSGIGVQCIDIMYDVCTGYYAQVCFSLFRSIIVVSLTGKLSPDGIKRCNHVYNILPPFTALISEILLSLCPLWPIP